MPSCATINAACVGSAILVAIVPLLALTDPGYAQAIAVGPNVRVRQITPTLRPVEAHLAVHRSDPNHLVGAAIGAPVADQWREMLSRQTCLVIVSRDGGESWQQHDLALEACLDPWVTITTDGQTVFSAFSSDRGEVVVFHSADGGITWTRQPTTLGTGHDRPTTVAAPRSPAGASTVYLVSSQLIRVDESRRLWIASVSRSSDGGRTFEPAVLLRGSRDRKAEVPVVTAEGVLIVPYVEPRDSAGAELAVRRGFIVISRDGGRTFAEPIPVSDDCGPPFRLSMLAQDNSAGPFHQRLYFVCNLPAESGVVLTHSGASYTEWSEARVVHSAAPDTAVRRKVMALTVNGLGVVGIVWTDARHARPGEECYDIYFTASLNGGETFLPEQRITEVTSCPKTDANGAIGRIFAPSGGDYIGMIADSDGRFRLMWSDARNGPFELWIAFVDVSGPVSPRD